MVPVMTRRLKWTRHVLTCLSVALLLSAQSAYAQNPSTDGLRPVDSLFDTTIIEAAPVQSLIATDHKYDNGKKNR